ncbi:hypothetical protein [Fodinicola feengrottensis]|uniref:PaaX family transcriptional regulator C-terminal domain-containing protein n=1 Tax=Fodinicola feengrottensis TaxID=435914 RepID=A0ABN2FYA2_9ACTN|nr:hypothetical protein [Fodinicola feengrottensis]
MTIVNQHVKSGRGRSVSFVPFVFGVSQQEELPGTVLTTLLGDLGLTTAAARALIARMQRDGQLAGTRRGRGVDYRLIGEFLRQFKRIQTAETRPPMRWTGAYDALLFQVPEQHRAYRDALRRHALFAGYGILQPGVLISLSDRRTVLESRLPDPPDGSRLLSARLEMSIEDAAEAACRGWDLLGLAEIYRAHLRSLRSELGKKSPLPATGATLRRWNELSVAALVDVGRLPDLPPELLPQNWPRPELLDALAKIEARFGGPSRAYVGSYGRQLR